MPSIIVHKLKHREPTPEERAAFERISKSITTEPVEDDFEGDFILSSTYIQQCPRLERTLQEYTRIRKEQDHA